MSKRENAIALAMVASIIALVEFFESVCGPYLPRTCTSLLDGISADLDELVDELTETEKENL